jgi:hypothetical protein
MVRPVAQSVETLMILVALTDASIATPFLSFNPAFTLLGAVFTVVWSAWLLHEHGLRQRLPATITMAID